MLKAIFALLMLVGTAQAQAPDDPPLPNITNNGALVTSTITPSMMVRNSYYTYDPRPDITAPELAEILRVVMPALACRNVLRPECDIREKIDALPEPVKRHFSFHER